MRRQPKRVSWAALAVGLACLCGCPEYQYDIDLVPHDAEIERSLTITRQHTEKPTPDEVERIARLYASHAITPDGQAHRFAGRFGGELPADIGGKGTYTPSATALGSVSVYLERFQGSDDLDEQIDKRRAAADEFTDILRGWFAEQLRDGPAAAKVDRFLDTTFRRDLRNLGHYILLNVAALFAPHEPDAEFAYGLPLQGELPARTAQFFAERDYLSLKEVAGLLRGMDERTDVGFIRRSLVRKAELSADEAGDIDFLLDVPAVLKSWQEYLERTPAFVAEVKAWDAQGRTERDATPPQAIEVIWRPFRSALGISFEFSDTLNIRLETTAKPWYTNGIWDPEANEVTWSTSPVSFLAGYPTIAFAAWCIPDSAFQTAHFGKIMLDNHALAGYVFWHAGLTDEEARQWDTFVEGLSPELNLQREIKQFTFTPDNEPLSGMVQDLILPSFIRGAGE